MTTFVLPIFAIVSKGSGLFKNHHIGFGCIFQLLPGELIRRGDPPSFRRAPAPELREPPINLTKEIILKYCHHQRQE
jgi:hypothetical protein